MVETQGRACEELSAKIKGAHHMDILPVDTKVEWKTTTQVAVDPFISWLYCGVTGKTDSTYVKHKSSATDAQVAYSYASIELLLESSRVYYPPHLCRAFLTIIRCLRYLNWEIYLRSQSDILRTSFNPRTNTVPLQPPPSTGVELGTGGVVPGTLPSDFIGDDLEKERLRICDRLQRGSFQILTNWTVCHDCVSRA